MFMPNENKKLGDVVDRLNKISKSFNISDTDDMTYSLVLRELEEISKELNLKGAIEEIQKLKDINTLLSFEKSRKEIFNQADYELHILNPVTDTIDMNVVIEDILKFPDEED